MPITRMNHAVLYVRDAPTTEQRSTATCSASAPSWPIPRARSCSCVRPAPTTITTSPSSASATSGPSEAGRRTVGLYHIAWEVPTLHDLRMMRDRLQQAGALVGASDHGANKSLYARDPDGLEFEVMWLVPPEHWGEAEHEAIIEPLDIDAEIAHYATVGLA